MLELEAYKVEDLSAYALPSQDTKENLIDIAQLLGVKGQ